MERDQLEQTEAIVCAILAAGLLASRTSPTTSDAVALYRSTLALMRRDGGPMELPAAPP